MADLLPASHADPEVVVDDLHKRFGEVLVLEGVNLTIRRGELVAIVGGSGCGKTVLLKTITFHFVPDSGRVLLADHEAPGSPLRDIATLDRDEMDRIRAHWAVVFQRNALLTGTVYYNLTLWPKEIKRQTDEELLPRARKALSDVGLDPDVQMFRDRDVLSGGMAKRVAIARALVMDPALVLYDEPTSGLDPEMASQIHELIRSTHLSMPQIGVPRTSIVVTHDTELLQQLRPRVIMLFKGKVSFDGNFEQFLGSDDPHIRPYLKQMAMLHARTPRD
jgi:phospholipid/cholesterol/gamma-HCH transport system ATP-binding protein